MNAVYQDRAGLWFMACSQCRAMDGGFRTKREAEVAYYNHNLKVHA